MRTKVTISVMIFSILFMSAWLIQDNDRNNRMNKITQTGRENNQNFIRNVNVEGNLEANSDMEPTSVIEPFKPREYIRIVR
ncbi:hypothetical protein [Rossellomorea sp. BNER]|uniref:hypothetical protein n=1 Tax=Rossellomorea sp. BNER TaxID=2962031 RepID=UPI003AF29464|nr:hypothetical protein [Rossellomorea sp. BNER]